MTKLYSYLAILFIGSMFVICNTRAQDSVWESNPTIYYMDSVGTVLEIRKDSMIVYDSLRAIKMLLNYSNAIKNNKNKVTNYNNDIKYANRN